MRSMTEAAYAGAPESTGALRVFTARPAKTRPDAFRVYSGTSDKRLHPAAVDRISVIKKQNSPRPHRRWSEAVLASVAGPGFEPG